MNTTDFGRKTPATITITDTTTRRHDYDDNNPRLVTGNCGIHCSREREKNKKRQVLVVTHPLNPRLAFKCAFVAFNLPQIVHLQGDWERNVVVLLLIGLLSDSSCILGGKNDVISASGFIRKGKETSSEK
jgi:hypothetical protein